MSIIRRPDAISINIFCYVLEKSCFMFKSLHFSR